jgi:hypothetical protein
MEEQQADLAQHLNEIADALEELARGTSVSLDMQFAYRHAARVVRA